MSRALALLVPALAVAGCTPVPDNFADAAPPADAPPPPTQLEATSRPLDTALDILFVVDDSNSMAQEQANLIANFPRFIGALEGVEGGLPDIHIGVISTDVGAGDDVDAACPPDGKNGRLQVRDACRALIPSGEHFLRSAPLGDGRRSTNFSGSLTTAFSCLAELGNRGCGFEQPLEAVRRALDGRNTQNAGFLRASSHLAVILLTDEDDCSASDRGLFAVDAPALGPRDSFRCFEQGVTCAEAARTPGVHTACRSNEASPYLTPVDSFVRFLRDLRGAGPDDDGAIVVAGMYGLEAGTLAPGPVTVAMEPDLPDTAELAPVCQTEATGAAVPGVRIDQFLRSFPGASTAASICNPSLEGALTRIGEQVRDQLGPDCITGELADTDPVAEGDQVQCTVTQVTAPGTAGEASIDVPRCSEAGNQAPCWRLVFDERRCPLGSHQAVDVLRAATVPPGTFLRRACAVVAP